jgi:hypothetical protein
LGDAVRMGRRTTRVGSPMTTFRSRGKDADIRN